MFLAIKPVSFIFGLLCLLISTCPAYSAPVIEVNNPKYPGVYLSTRRDSPVRYVHLFPLQKDQIMIRMKVEGKIPKEESFLMAIDSVFPPTCAFSITIKSNTIEITLDNKILPGSLADSIDQIPRLFSPTGLGHNPQSSALFIHAIGQVFNFLLPSIPEDMPLYEAGELEYGRTRYGGPSLVEESLKGFSLDGLDDFNLDGPSQVEETRFGVPSSVEDLPESFRLDVREDFSLDGPSSAEDPLGRLGACFYIYLKQLRLWL